MIGRSDPDAGRTRKHYVIGSAQVTPELKTTIAAVNAKTVKWPLDFESQESSMSGSDHYQFHLKGIPTAFLFSGRHEDLHAPDRRCREDRFREGAAALAADLRGDGRTGQP